MTAEGTPVSETILIYVAGNPDAYPIEYYDEQTQSYQGVIPQLLSRFSSASGYEVVYYQPGERDARAHLGNNNQVDLLSGYLEGEYVPSSVASIPLFSAHTDGETQTYCIHLTRAAPAQLLSDLQAFSQAVPQEEISGILIDTAAARTGGLSPGMAGTLLVAAVLLAFGVSLVIRRYRKRLSQALAAAQSDPVTGVGNLTYLDEQYRRQIIPRNRILYHLVYFFVDTDHLRRISDSQETDDFLRYCAAMLTEYLEPGDILARVSDHGFAMFRMKEDAAQVYAWAATVVGKMQSYPQLYSKPFEISASAGIYSLKAREGPLPDLIFTASQGAFSAARENMDYVICTPEMQQQLAQEKFLQASIEQAFARREFKLYIQFYVDAMTGEIVGGEALSRWNHPQQGVLMPGVFVPLMERERLISRLDYYCLEESCAFLQRLVEYGIDAFFISCNFSRETFSAPDFSSRAKDIMERYRFPRELLIFEITESASVQRVVQIRQNIIALRQYGIRVALDDFGEGLTSFYDLHKYPIDGIKLDKGLIDYTLTPSGAAILKAMVQVGHELNMTILAEGVESQQQARALQEIRCDVIQGFYFYHPLPDWEAEQKILAQFASRDHSAEEQTKNHP